MSTVFLDPTTGTHHWASWTHRDRSRVRNCTGDAVERWAGVDPSLVPPGLRCRAPGCRGGWPDWHPVVGEAAEVAS